MSLIALIEEILDATLLDGVTTCMRCDKPLVTQRAMFLGLCAKCEVEMEQEDRG